MKLYAKKRMLVVAMACLVGFQPTVDAQDIHEQLKALAGLVLLFSSKLIWRQSVNLVHYVLDKSYVIYRNAKYYRCHSESHQLSEAKKFFNKEFGALDLENQHAWSGDCYPQLFSKDPNAVKTIENFIEGKEELNDSKLPLFNSDYAFLDKNSVKDIEGRVRQADLQITEYHLLKNAFQQKVVRDVFDVYFLADYGLSRIKNARKNEVGRLLGACCAAYPCERNVREAVTCQYPDIKASDLFKGFKAANLANNPGDSVNKRPLITTQVLLAHLAAK